MYKISSIIRWLFVHLVHKMIPFTPALMQNEFKGIPVPEVHKPGQGDLVAPRPRPAYFVSNETFQMLCLMILQRGCVEYKFAVKPFCTLMIWPDQLEIDADMASEPIAVQLMLILADFLVVAHSEVPSVLDLLCS